MLLKTVLIVYIELFNILIYNINNLIQEMVDSFLFII